MRGVVLLAIGHPHYGCFAFNMATSIKAHNPDIAIQIIYGDKTLDYLSKRQQSVFDVFTEIKPEDYTHNGIQPGKAKASIYPYLHFEDNIILDVDGVCIKDIGPLFDLCVNDFHAHIVSQTNQDSEIWPCGWMTLDKIKEHYKLPVKFNLFDINTTFMFVRKGDKMKRFFNSVRENVRFDIPKEEFKGYWGYKKLFPDELAFDVAMAQHGINPSIEVNVVHLRQRKDIGGNPSLADLAKNHFCIGIYAAEVQNHPTIFGLYDTVAHDSSSVVFNQNGVFKIHELINSKLVSQNDN